MTLDLTKLTILLAEDALSMRKIEINLLQSIGITQVIEAEDGEAGIRLLRENKVDLIISDWNMPRRTGLSFLEWVRTQDAYRHIPFLMATAQSDKEQGSVARKAGANGVLAKPFSLEELRAAITAVFDTSKKQEKKAVLQPALNSAGKVILRMAHIQITDHIILGILKHLIDSGVIKPQHFELDTRCMGGWNPVGQALEEGGVEGAFILAPIAMDLFNFGVPIKLVLFAHRGGSIFVRNAANPFSEPYSQFYKGQSFLIPHKLSIHHMLTHLFFKNIGLKASLDKGNDIDVNLEVAPPVKMPVMLKEEAKVSGFMVAEPIGTKTIASGAAQLQFLSNELWKGHPCCVVVMRNEVISQYEEAVEELVRFLVQAGRFVTEQPGKAAEIAVPFLDAQGNLELKAAVLRNVLMEQNGVRTDNLYPVREDLDQIQKYMVNEMGVGRLTDLDSFVDLKFADAVYHGSPPAHLASFLDDSPAHSLSLLRREKVGGVSKSMLSREGKYLTFDCGGQEFGIDIHRIREIIGIMEINSLPQAHRYIKGVINLRDRVIPIMDLRLRFAFPATENTEKTCIIIVDGEMAGKLSLVGLIVDSVTEVMSFRADDIEDSPTFTSSVNTRYILAMAKKAEKVKILLNMDQVLAFQQER